MRKLIYIVLSLFLFSACTQEEIPKELAVGDVAPDFAAKDLSGNVVILSYFTEQPVVLRFFETDCKFCKADTPIINVYFDKYKEQGLKVFYIAAYHENKERVSRFVDDLEVGFPVIVDQGAKIADLYNVLLYPQTIMIVPGRKVAAIIPGGIGEAELDEMVGPYLSQENNENSQTNS